MKTFGFAVSLLIAALSTGVAAEPSDANQKIVTFAREIQAQQVLIAENQAKIDAKLALVAEAVRVAKIYSSRSGR